MEIQFDLIQNFWMKIRFAMRMFIFSRRPGPLPVLLRPGCGRGGLTRRGALLRPRPLEVLGGIRFVPDVIKLAVFQRPLVRLFQGPLRAAASNAGPGPPAPVKGSGPQSPVLDLDPPQSTNSWHIFPSQILPPPRASCGPRHSVMPYYLLVQGNKTFCQDYCSFLRSVCSLLLPDGCLAQ
jgi:hypothetical protein